MYCYHCGKKINERKLESKSSSFNNIEEVESIDAQINYVCPRCGYLIHDNASEEDLKSLSRAAHAQIQRGSNHFASGMGFTVLSVIIAALAVTFYLLSLKRENGVTYILHNSSTFLVFVVMSIIALFLLVLGVVNLVIGVSKKVKYTSLLKDLNNKTFVQ